MPLPLTFSCSSKIQIGFSFLVPAYPGCPGKEAVKWLLLLLLADENYICTALLKTVKVRIQLVVQLAVKYSSSRLGETF